MSPVAHEVDTSPKEQRKLYDLDKRLVGRLQGDIPHRCTFELYKVLNRYQNLRCELRSAFSDIIGTFGIVDFEVRFCTVKRGRKSTRAFVVTWTTELPGPQREFNFTSCSEQFGPEFSVLESWQERTTWKMYLYPINTKEKTW